VSLFFFFWSQEKPNVHNKKRSNEGKKEEVVDYETFPLSSELELLHTRDGYIGIVPVMQALNDTNKKKVNSVEFRALTDLHNVLKYVDNKVKVMPNRFKQPEIVAHCSDEQSSVFGGSYPAIEVIGLLNKIMYKLIPTAISK